MPCYNLLPSEGSRRGQNFTVGDGGDLPSQGKKTLSLESEDGKEQFETIFTIAKVSRPLMSAGLICDKGYDIHMSAERANITSSGKVVLTFTRELAAST